MSKLIRDVQDACDLMRQDYYEVTKIEFNEVGFRQFADELAKLGLKQFPALPPDWKPVYGIKVASFMGIPVFLNEEADRFSVIAERKPPNG